MNILITGASGFVGKNLAENLKNIRDGKNKTRPGLKIEDIFEFDKATPKEKLSDYCERADFVFNLAGVNRAEGAGELMKGSFGFAEELIECFKKCGNTCPVMLASSVQATLIGRYDGSEYGKSKLKCEELFFSYARETGARVLIYRFPNIFGKWCRPNYNSAVATFCHNTANGIPLSIDDESTELELLYIDDLVEELFDALEGREHRCSYFGLSPIEDKNGKYCFAPITHRATLGEVASLLESFKKQSETLMMPEIKPGSFEKKLYSTYASYLPPEKVSLELKMNKDDRGSFTELLKTEKCGQLSVNVSLPGVTKGRHWHNSKWEIFIVVSGEGLIRQRKVGGDEVLDFYVSGEKPEAVHILPGYTHDIINLSDSEKLVTLMWVNECFDGERPDTFSLEV